MNISCPLIQTFTCVYQGVRNVSFLESFANVLNEYEWSFRTIVNPFHTNVIFLYHVKTLENYGNFTWYRSEILSRLLMPSWLTKFADKWLRLFLTIHVQNLFREMPIFVLISYKWILGITMDQEEVHQN